MGRTRSPRAPGSGGRTRRGRASGHRARHPGGAGRAGRPKAPSTRRSVGYWGVPCTPRCQVADRAGADPGALGQARLRQPRGQAVAPEQGPEPDRSVAGVAARHPRAPPSRHPAPRVRPLRAGRPDGQHPRRAQEGVTRDGRGGEAVEHSGSCAGCIAYIGDGCAWCGAGALGHTGSVGAASGNRRWIPGNAGPALPSGLSRLGRAGSPPREDGAPVASCRTQEAVRTTPRAGTHGARPPGPGTRRPGPAGRSGPTEPAHAGAAARAPDCGGRLPRPAARATAGWGDGVRPPATAAATGAGAYPLDGAGGPSGALAAPHEASLPACRRRRRRVGPCPHRLPSRAVMLGPGRGATAFRNGLAPGLLTLWRCSTL